MVEGRYEGLNLTPPEEGFELYRHKTPHRGAIRRTLESFRRDTEAQRATA